MVIQLKDWQVQRRGSVNIGAMDFALQQEEIISVMGPSGCGKSTWLMTLLGYEELGLSITGDRLQHGKRLAPNAVPSDALYIPQNLPFNPNWEVQGFLSRLPWGNPNLLDTIFPTSPKRLQRVREVLHQLGLSGRERATVAELSGGEAQRAAVAQVLLMSPKLLIGDEFVSGLDPGMSAWILERCRENMASSGGAAILALHDVQTALRISDRILIVFPPYVDTQPWELKRGDIAWHGNLLNTLLCLARLAKDSIPRESIRVLARYIHHWIEDENAINQFAAQCKDLSTVLLSASGEIQPVEVDLINTPLPLSNEPNRRQEMIHTRVFLSGEFRIGVTLPPTSECNSLTVLA